MIGSTILILILSYLNVRLVNRRVSRYVLRSGPTRDDLRERYIRKTLKKMHLNAVNSDSIARFDKNGGVCLSGSWRSGGAEIKRLRLRVVVLVFFSLLLVLTYNFYFIFGVGAAFSSTQSGDWDVGATWGGIPHPVTGDTAQINNTHNVRIDAGTGNEGCLSTDIQAGGTLTIDSEGGGALSLTFDDNAAAGFGASDGNLTCVGSDGNVVTLTSTGAPPTNFWDANTNMDFTMDFTLLEYFNEFGVNFNMQCDIDDTTFQNSDANTMVVIRNGDVQSFDNITINAGASQTARVLNLYDTSVTYTNLVIAGTFTGNDIQLRANGIFELVDSNIDITNVNPISSGRTLISKNHGDVAGDWYYVAFDTANKSSITNDFTSSDNVTIQTGKLVVDENANHIDLTIKSGGEFEINAGIGWVVGNTGTVTIESGGTLDINGTVASRVVIQSSLEDNRFSMDAQAGSTVTVTGVDVVDSDASAGETIIATDGTSKGDNTVNWNFGAISSGGRPQLPFWLKGVA